MRFLTFIMNDVVIAQIPTHLPDEVVEDLDKKLTEVLFYNHACEICITEQLSYS